MNSRLWKDWTNEKVEDIPLAPHRYKYDEDTDPDPDLPIREWRKKVVYQPGDVVLVKDWTSSGLEARRYKIIGVYVGYNRYSERREYYRAVPETRAGYWSKLWENIYPGPIQRGYKLAGLAPEAT